MTPHSDEDENNKRLREQLLGELKSNKELIDKGDDQNSPSGSDDCPSDDNFSTAVLRHLLPIAVRRKRGAPASSHVRAQLSTIFGLGGKRVAPPETKLKMKQKEEKRPAKLATEKKPERIVLPVPKVESHVTEEEAKKEPPVPTAAVVMVDAWTQTEKIDFARARYALYHQYRHAIDQR